MIEEWRDISGFEGKYQVSNLGKVKSLNYNHTGKEHILSQKNRRNGYKEVLLYDLDGNRDYRLVHRLVAEVFIPNPEKPTASQSHWRR